MIWCGVVYFTVLCCALAYCGVVYCTAFYSTLLHYSSAAVTCISILSCSLDAQEEREEAEAAQVEQAKRELAKQMEEAATRIMEGRRKENVEKVVHCVCLAVTDQCVGQVKQVEALCVAVFGIEKLIAVQTEHLAHVLLTDVVPEMNVKLRPDISDLVRLDWCCGDDWCCCVACCCVELHLHLLLVLCIDCYFTPGPQCSCLFH